MVVVPLAASANEPDANPPISTVDSMYWVRVAAAGALATSGVLLMAGKRRAGLAAAIGGAALAIMDQQDTVRTWWTRMPGFLEETQSILTRVQGSVDELSAQGERLRGIFSR